jgi:hypothetical protein
MGDAMRSTGEEDAALRDFEDGGGLGGCTSGIADFIYEASEESLRAALLELESEKKARKVAETSNAELESAISRLKDLAHKATCVEDYNRNHFQKKRGNLPMEDLVVTSLM